MVLSIELAALVLFAAVCHALWNTFVKSSGEQSFTMAAVLLGPAIAGAVLAAVFPMPAPESWPYLAAGVAAHTIYYIFLLNAYRVGDLSHVYPLSRGIAPLVVALAAFLFVGETLPPMAMLGVALASLGIMSLVLTQWRLPRLQRLPTLFALITGLCIAAYTVIDGTGVRLSGQVLAYIGWLNILKPIPILLWVLATRGRAFVRFTVANWRYSLAGGFFNLFAYTLVLYALAHGAMAPVAALRETSVIFAAAIGALVLREGFGRRRIFAAVLVSGGIILMTTAQAIYTTAPAIGATPVRADTGI